MGAAWLVLIAAHAWGAEYWATIKSNYDGDTLSVGMFATYQGITSSRETVRIINIDAPEIRGKCDEEKALAIKARDFIEGWHGRRITLVVPDKRPRDQYGRLLAYVRNERGEDLGEKLVEAGLAVRWAGKRHQGWCNR